PLDSCLQGRVGAVHPKTAEQVPAVRGGEPVHVHPLVGGGGEQGGERRPAGHDAQRSVLVVGEQGKEGGEVLTPTQAVAIARLILSPLEPVEDENVAPASRGGHDVVRAGAGRSPLGGVTADEQKGSLEELFGVAAVESPPEGA